MSDYLWDKAGTDPEIEGLELKLGEFAYAPRPDYLWSKEGEDAEVQQLEQALAPLAYDGEPPVLPLQHVRRTPSFGAPWKHAKLTPLALAAGLVLMSLAVAWNALTTERHRDWELVPVLVATAELPEGTVVTPQVVEERLVPARFVSSTVVTPQGSSIVLGQKVQVAVAAGDPLLWSQFESARAIEHLASRIVRGARALAVEVEDRTGVAALLQPEDHVDVIASLLDPKTNQTVAVTLMQDVPVLAKGRQEADSVALMVLPEEAALLTFAQEFGELRFTVRGAEDRETARALLTTERERALSRKRARTIQVIRSAPAP